MTLWRCFSLSPVLWSYRSEPHNQIKEDESHFCRDVLGFFTICLFSSHTSFHPAAGLFPQFECLRASGLSLLRFHIVHCPGASRQDVLTSRVEVMTMSPIKQIRKRQTSDKHPAFLYGTEHLWGDRVPLCRSLLMSPSGRGVQAAGISPINSTSAQFALGIYNGRRTGGFRMAQFCKTIPP